MQQKKRDDHYQFKFQSVAIHDFPIVLRALKIKVQFFNIYIILKFLKDS